MMVGEENEEPSCAPDLVLIRGNLGKLFAVLLVLDRDQREELQVATCCCALSRCNQSLDGLFRDRHLLEFADRTMIEELPEVRKIGCLGAVAEGPCCGGSFFKHSFILADETWVKMNLMQRPVKQ